MRTKTSKLKKTTKMSISYTNLLTLKYSMLTNALTILTTNTTFTIEFIDKITTKMKERESRWSMSNTWKICWKLFIKLISASQMLVKSLNIDDFAKQQAKNENAINFKKKVYEFRASVWIDELIQFWNFDQNLKIFILSISTRQ